MKKNDKPPVDWLAYENGCRAQGFSAVCGVDEAGRGPLCGPVYAAAVILPPGTVIGGVNDSKKLSENKREALYDTIKQTALACAVASASVEEIESLNILNAAMLAMSRAVEALSVRPDMVLVDGNRLPSGLPCDAAAIVGGDALSESIACASILAKVSRDRYMREMALKYPQYGFEKHKGYGTGAHIEALRKYGMCPEHRPSFLRKIGGIPGGDGA